MTRIILACLLLLALCGCGGRSGTMNFCRYDQIVIGESIVEVERCNGPPYCVQCNEEGQEEYVYIERTKRGPDAGGQTHYFILVEDGTVVDKSMRCLNAPFDIIMHDRFAPL